MFGSLRFILAILVAVSHLDFMIPLPGPGTISPGIFAVVIFYILSGYVMASSFSRNYGLSISKAPAFWIDRIFRVFPQYLFFVILTTLFLALTNYGNPQFHPGAFLSNLLIVPLNYYMFFDSSILQNPKWPLVPPAWSLGAELQFYALVPLLLSQPKLRFIASGVSFFIFSLASFRLINHDYYSYRLIPGVLFIFLSGSFIYFCNFNYPEPDEQLSKNWVRAKPDFLAILLLYLLIFLTLFGLFYSQKLFVPYSSDVIVGLIVGVSLISFLSRIKQNHLDDFLGNLSYGIFLSHFIGIWLFDLLAQNSCKFCGSSFQASVVILFSIAMGYIGYKLIDEPVKIMRRKLRSRLSE